jgi:LAO/AO transport system kinase
MATPDPPEPAAAEPQTLAAALASALAAGDRRALARAVTLVESVRPDHRAAAEALLAALPARRALRLALTGTPGAGKSSLAEALGLRLTAAGRRVAVLAIDPSSARSGGSILGDKTRMERLARDPRAFVRPSPAGAVLGGLARRSREGVALCEAAGFDVVLIETVGIGQAEAAAADAADVVVLVLAPAAGDELQAVKRGVTETADLVAVNKADGETLAAARRAAADYGAALRLLAPRPGDPEGIPRALAVSAQSGAGLDELLGAVEALWSWRRDTGWLERRRRAQRRQWFEDELAQQALARLRADPAVAARLAALAREVEEGRLSPGLAAARALG